MSRIQQQIYALKFSNRIADLKTSPNDETRLTSPVTVYNDNVSESKRLARVLNRIFRHPILGLYIHLFLLRVNYKDNMEISIIIIFF